MKRPFKCKFCKKGFSSEKTLSAHLCKKKKRYADRNTAGSMLGFRVFQRFYELTTTSKKPKTVEDFIDSRYYLDFVKFARYLIDLHPISADKFIDFVIINSVKLNDWQKQHVYDAYLVELMKKESADKALERTVLTMQEWCKENNAEFKEFFNVISPSEAVWLIKSGRISPWILYIAESADILWSKMNSEQGKIISNVVDPEFWQEKIQNSIEDVKFIKSVVDAAGL